VFLFEPFQLGPTAIEFRQPGQGDLGSNELAARVVLLVEPVRVDQPGAVVVWLFADAGEKPVRLRPHKDLGAGSLYRINLARIENSIATILVGCNIASVNSNDE